MSLEEIKQRKLQELQHQLEDQQTEQHQMLQQIELVETFAKRYLDSKAISRYGNLKAAHPEKAIQVAALITRGAQSGQIQGQITDIQFRELLLRLQPPKHETKIVRK
jgi:DNA-binding TFAR19-related protein (PDSD5 family)